MTDGMLSQRKIRVAQVECDDAWIRAAETLPAAIGWLARRGYRAHWLCASGLKEPDPGTPAEYFAYSNCVPARRGGEQTLRPQR